MSAAEIAKKVKRERRPTTRSGAANSALPTSPSDPVRDLAGDHDLVFPVHVIDDHTTGPDRDWLKATTFPQQLRQGGWVYLKVADRVLARARALRVEYREGLCYHTPDETGVRAELGASAVIAVDGDSWEEVDFPADERHLQGYRYASTDDDTWTVTHLVGGQPTESHPLRPDLR